LSYFYTRGVPNQNTKAKFLIREKIATQSWGALV